MEHNTINDPTPALALPTEITLHISAYLPYSTLVNISLVCKTWRFGVLPLLFRSITLTSDENIAHFSCTIASDDESTSCHASQCIRSLSITSDSTNKLITESGLAHLATCVPHLVHLVQLHWCITFVPADRTVLKLFQTSFPQLRSVSLLVPDGHQFQNELEESHYAALLGFKNLSEFQLQIPQISPDISTKAFRPLKQLISTCPGLEFLQLYIHSPISHSVLGYTPDDIAIWLGLELPMPSLRRLHLLGSVHIDERDFVSSPDTGTHHFRDFLSQHMHIEELYLDGLAWGASPSAANPEYLAQALPSLKRFSGPDVLCDLLIRSSVSQRLECLSVEKCNFKGGLSFAAHRLPKILSLPALRELVIETKMYYQVLTILEAILPEAPGLESLGLVPVPLACHAMFLGLIGHTPGLRKTSIFNFTSTAIDPVRLSQLAQENSAEHHLYSKMKQACPKLEVAGPWLPSTVPNKRGAGLIFC
ncbi:unnamed protein product [Rhizoctonia solani]|uniref:F-box domain-containing protein n=1 Tax=Rhizoctonia solani TaxID=456999 RepID=A0A8H2XCQ2_9AGAM|nr:unnamed protein product [Rhizoctonia solani]